MRTTLGAGAGRCVGAGRSGPGGWGGGQSGLDLVGAARTAHCWLLNRSTFRPVAGAGFGQAGFIRNAGRQTPVPGGPYSFGQTHSVLKPHRQAPTLAGVLSRTGQGRAEEARLGGRGHQSSKIGQACGWAPGSAPLGRRAGRTGAHPEGCGSHGVSAESRCRPKLGPWQNAFRWEMVGSGKRSDRPDWHPAGLLPGGTALSST